MDDAFLQAILVEPDEDLHRLVYADWLEDNNDPDRAAFIRLQIEMEKAPSSPGEVADRVERWEEVVSRVRHRIEQWQPSWPAGLHPYLDFGRFDAGPFRRGFPDVLDAGWYNGDRPYSPPDHVFQEFLEALPVVLRETTARTLHLNSFTLERLQATLGNRAMSELNGLSLFPVSNSYLITPHIINSLLRSPCLPQLESLSLGFGIEMYHNHELFSAALNRLRSFTCHTIRAFGPNPYSRVFASTWFNRLQQLSGSFTSVFREGIAFLPDLRALTLENASGTWREDLRTPGFAVLSTLRLFRARMNPPLVSELAQEALPQLAVLEVRDSELTGPQLRPLLAGGWAEQLRILDLSDNHLDDRAVVQLANSAVANRLRILRLGNNPFWGEGLTALGSGAFPNLTTLDLGSTRTLRSAEDALRKLLRTGNLPRLRHLILDGWPVGNAGAKALASNAGFGPLTRLSLISCGLWGTNVDLLLQSPHLQRLVDLRVDTRAARTARFLHDPQWLSRWIR